MQLFLRKIGILEHGLNLSATERQNAEAETGEKPPGNMQNLHTENVYFLENHVYSVYFLPSQAKSGNHPQHHKQNQF